MRSRSAAAAGRATVGAAYFVGGLALLLAVWWLAIYFASKNPALSQFTAFGPAPAFKAKPPKWESGLISKALKSSGDRLRFRELSNSPFQLMRMISPLSWEPIAVIVFAGWNSAIIFLIAIAAVWPIMFSTAAGLSKVDPAWFKVARNLGAKPWQMVTEIIIPAIMFDVMTGIRLAVGVAWIVLVPAEFLGVTSGFGYTIEDARESLEYEHLMAMLIVIGIVGYVLDLGCQALIRRYSWHK